ncbi:hypothetical protein J6590_007031 [Homalodisca vitripennis]|nr:hypothetical protein J6590_007031 [Homalodisca vitripennis]
MCYNDGVPVGCGWGLLDTEGGMGWWRRAGAASLALSASTTLPLTLALPPRRQQECRPSRPAGQSNCWLGNGSTLYSSHPDMLVARQRVVWYQMSDNDNNVSFKFGIG